MKTNLAVRMILARSALTQARVAYRLGVTQSSVSMWLNGWAPVPVDRRAALAQAMRCTQEELDEALATKTRKRKTVAA